MHTNDGAIRLDVLNLNNCERRPVVACMDLTKRAPLCTGYCLPFLLPDSIDSRTPVLSAVTSSSGCRKNLFLLLPPTSQIDLMASASVKRVSWYYYITTRFTCRVMRPCCQGAMAMNAIGIVCQWDANERRRKVAEVTPSGCLSDDSRDGNEETAL
jgi:hypothetical protein